VSPGLNNFIRSVYNELSYNYGVSRILGIRHGFLGLTDAGEPPLPLTYDFIDNIHERGGTVLGTSRGPQDPERMTDFLVKHGINVLFVVGGDGSMKGAASICGAVQRRGLRIAIVGGPKTIDDDIAFVEPSFGYTTAIEEATRAIVSAHNEARSHQRGIGLVKVMGRHAGFIAAGATIASQTCNMTLVPEVRFPLDGPDGLLAVLERRFEKRDHCVILVAEGAGQHLFAATGGRADASGNVRPEDIGPYLAERITAHFARAGQPVTLKYIDPSYIIRSVAANTTDQILCDQMARHAVHAAMAGFTDVLIGHVHKLDVLVPIACAVAHPKRMEVHGQLWSSVLLTTGQPNWPAEPALGGAGVAHQ
jgi:6-phosphofructokinase 1